MKRVIGLTVATVLTWVVLAPQATAASVECGDVLTESIKLEADLSDCPDDGLVVGADRITIDLNGHEVSGACVDPDCEGRVGIDNSGGHDRVQIRNGTVERGFGQSILLKRASRNSLTGLVVKGGGSFDHGSNSIALEESDRNVIKDSAINGGDPAVKLTASDHNRISRTTIAGGIFIRTGGGLVISEGSDANVLIDSDVDAESGAMDVVDSDRNVVRRSAVGAHGGAIYLVDADRTLIVGNDLDGQQAGAVSAQGDRNTIRDNVVDTGIGLRGDRNLVAANRIRGDGNFGACPLGVGAGDRNVIRNNEATSCFLGPVIYVRGEATRTSLIGNSASGAFGVEEDPGDGIKVEAPGTLIRGNTANDNSQLGINAVDGVIDGGGNHASGNGDPRQCVGVVCTP